MGTIIEITIFMLVIATVAFAPLAYFIYNYTKKDGEPFGDFEHPQHGHSIIDDLAEKAKEKISEKMAH
jgi:heme/copper-type cytochrome/quinol oxidase subunit 2